MAASGKALMHALSTLWNSGSKINSKQLVYTTTTFFATYTSIVVFQQRYVQQTVHCYIHTAFFVVSFTKSSFMTAVHAWFI